MSSFAGPTTPTAEKLRGGYYTPDSVARFIAEWIGEASQRVLEPSCGDGAILHELASRFPATNLLGLEWNEVEARRCADRVPSAEVLPGDFFEWFGPKEFGRWDGVAGNPPFIRYQHWTSDVRDRAFDLMRSVGMRPTRLTNAWVPFVVASTLALRDGGRLGLVVPAEVMQVGYAAELRAFLVDTLSELTAVTFRTLLFKGVLQEVILLLGLRGEGPARIRVVEVDDADALPVSPAVVTEVAHAPALEHDREKWTRYLLSPNEIAALRDVQQGERVPTTLGDFAEVDVGVVTGRNAFFVLPENQAVQLGLVNMCVPLVSKSAHVAGLRLTPDRLGALTAENARCLLLAVSDSQSLDADSALLEYVRDGERAGVHLGYKCRIRKNWWVVPSIWTPEAFLLRQIYDHPRVIANEAGATSTDTIHRVRVRSGVDPVKLAVGSINSVTFAFAEVLGRSYGGGVLELEPREAELLPFPNPRRLTAQDVSRVEALVERGCLTDALDEVDRILLSNLDARVLGHMRQTWIKLRDRRLARGRKPTRDSPVTASLAA